MGCCIRMTDFKSSKRIIGTSAERATFAISAPQWQELGRTTLSSASNTIAVTGLTAKPYMMVLEHCLADGSTMGTKLRYNSDSGSNYAWRRSTNGGSDITGTSASALQYDGLGDGNDAFMVWQGKNTSDKEKLTIGHVAKRGSAGASNAPDRFEVVGKWANTSDNITSVSEIDNDNNGFASGSEVVVLGYDPDDTSGTNFWQELASVELSSSATSISSGTISAKKYLWVQVHTTGHSSGENDAFQFNSDTSANYSQRRSSNGSSDSTDTNMSEIELWGTGTATTKLVNMFVINKSDKEKLCNIELTNSNSSGSGNAPYRAELAAKWVNTSNQITSIQYGDLVGGTVTMDSGTTMKVWGSD